MTDKYGILLQVIENEWVIFLCEGKMGKEKRKRKRKRELGRCRERKRKRKRKRKKETSDGWKYIPISIEAANQRLSYYLITTSE